MSVSPAANPHLVGDIKMQSSHLHIELYEVSFFHERQWPSGSGLRAHVQNRTSVCCTIHANKYIYDV